MKTRVVYFRIAPSIGILCLVAETQKRVLAEPEAMLEAETCRSAAWPDGYSGWEDGEKTLLAGVLRMRSI